MKVLIIEDAIWNIGSYALVGLDEHQVTILSSLQEVDKLLKKKDGLKEFDVVLTDLFLPWEHLLIYSEERGEDQGMNEIPIGLVVAMKALNEGIPVAILTDSDHHTNKVVATLEGLRFRESAEDTLIVSEARNVNCAPFFYDTTIEQVVLRSDCGDRVHDPKTHELLDTFNFSRHRRIKSWHKLLRDLTKPWSDRTDSW